MIWRGMLPLLYISGVTAGCVMLCAAANPSTPLSRAGNEVECCLRMFGGSSVPWQRRQYIFVLQRRGLDPCRRPRWYACRRLWKCNPHSLVSGLEELRYRIFVTPGRVESLPRNSPETIAFLSLFCFTNIHSMPYIGCIKATFGLEINLTS